MDGGGAEGGRGKKGKNYAKNTLGRGMSGSDLNYGRNFKKNYVCVIPYWLDNFYQII